MPQIFRWENIGFIFGQMKIDPLNQFTYILQKESLLKMQQRYILIHLVWLCSSHRHRKEFRAAPL